MQSSTDVDITASRSWPIASDRVRVPGAPRPLLSGLGILLADLCATLIVPSAILPLLRLDSGGGTHPLGSGQLTSRDR